MENDKNMTKLQKVYEKNNIDIKKIKTTKLKK